MTTSDQDVGKSASSGSSAATPRGVVQFAAIRRGRGGGKAPASESFPLGTGEGPVFAYVRRSAEDRSGRPLHAQIETINSYVAGCDCIVPRGSGIRKLYVDNGISGATPPDRRPGMSALIADLTAYTRQNLHSQTHVVIYDATRLARATDVGTALKSTFDRLGATLHLAQSRMVVRGETAELFFGLNLQMAASERTATINRVKSSFYHNPSWDPRRSYGWRFMGAGRPPEPVPEEQAVLAEIEQMYTVDGLSVSEIARVVSEKHGPRRVRREGVAAAAADDLMTATNPTTTPWSTTDISFLARKKGWKWSGGNSISDIEAEIFAAREEGTTLDEFLERHRGMMVDGVKINRAMLKRYFLSEMPEWRMRAFAMMEKWCRDPKYSIDDLANLLTEEVPRPDGRGWARQTTWRIMKEVQRQDARRKSIQTATATAAESQPPPKRKRTTTDNE